MQPVLPAPLGEGSIAMLGDYVLRRYRDSFFHLIEQAPFGVYVIDSQFRIHQVNSGAQQAFVNLRPLIGRDFAEASASSGPSRLPARSSPASGTR